jgi:NADPH-ferrihemoprotein reductase
MLHHLDICGPGSRGFLRQLIVYCPTERAKDMISGWVKNKTSFQEEVTHRHLSISKVMQLAGGNAVWDTFPFSLLVEFLGKLQPRYYSIASSPPVSPQQPSIIVAVTSKTFDEDTHFRGVASNYLLGLMAAKRSPNDVTSEALDLET